MRNIIYSFWSIHVFMHLLVNNVNVYGFLHQNRIMKCNKYIKSTIQDYQYEYQNDWTSGEVPWEFIELDNVLYNQYNNIIVPPAKIDSEFVVDDSSIDLPIMSFVYNTNEYTNEYTTIDTEFDNTMITKAIVSGVMKGIYVQILSIDNMITYTQCYTNKVIDMDILLSLLYFIIYEKIKNIEIENIIILKKYNNIQLFEKYIKMRRVSMLAIIIIYVILFRGISNVE